MRAINAIGCHAVIPPCVKQLTTSSCTEIIFGCVTTYDIDWIWPGSYPSAPHVADRRQVQNNVWLGSGTDVNICRGRWPQHASTPLFCIKIQVEDVMGGSETRNRPRITFIVGWGTYLEASSSITWLVNRKAEHTEPIEEMVMTVVWFAIWTCLLRGRKQQLWSCANTSIKTALCRAIHFSQVYSAIQKSNST